MRRATAAAALIGICANALGADPVFTLVSPDLPVGKPIPERFTANAFGCHGPNESPALKWSNAPAGTKSFAVTMFDPYRPPASGWWHWVVYDIPATTTELPRKAGAPGDPGMPHKVPGRLNPTVRRRRLTTTVLALTRAIRRITTRLPCMH